MELVLLSATYYALLNLFSSHTPETYDILFDSILESLEAHSNVI